MAAPIIVGAGLAGLLAAHAWPQLEIVERNPEPTESHKALLRFRNDSVSKLTGVDFRQVLVRKAVWSGGAFVAPTIAHANRYSLKCLGKVLPDRSIWNLDPVTRFVAPDDFYDTLIQAVRSRVRWGCQMDFTIGQSCISTAPLPLTLESLGIETELTFDRAPIVVQRATVPMCDAFQTVYYPDPATKLYRASITGDTLIAEFVSEPEDGWIERQIVPAFGVDNFLFKDRRRHHQQFGKIAPVDDAARKALLFELTQRHHIFSLGRFATWRNVLLDDVVEDIAVIKRLMRSQSYERKRASV